MKTWMIAALLGALFGLTLRRWLAIDGGRGQTFEHPYGRSITVIVGLGNTVNYNRLPPVSTLPASKESSHAEGA